MTLNEARAALTIPAYAQNNNCVQDGVYLLREAISLATYSHKEDEAAPDYVVKAVGDLQRWVDHAAQKRT